MALVWDGTTSDKLATTRVGSLTIDTSCAYSACGWATANNGAGTKAGVTICLYDSINSKQFSIKKRAASDALNAFGYGAGPYFDPTASGLTIPDDNTWFFWAAAVSGTAAGNATLYVWVPGTGWASDANSVALQAVTTPDKLLMGGGPTANEEWIGKHLSNKVWNAVLTADEFERERLSLYPRRIKDLHSCVLGIGQGAASAQRDMCGPDWTLTGTITYDDSHPSYVSGGLPIWMPQSAVYSESASDSAAATETAAAALTVALAVADSGAATDSATAGLTASDAASDTAAGTDAAVSGLSAATSAADSADVTDSAATVLSAAESASDSADGTDAATGILTVAESASDTADATDDAAGSITVAVAVTDSAAATDAAAAELVAADAVADSAAASDAAEATASKDEAVADSAAATDTATASAVLAEAVSDAAAGSETAVAVATFAEAVSDSTAASEAVSDSLGSVTYNESAEDTAAASETVASLAVLGDAVSDSAAGSETVAISSAPPVTTAYPGPAGKSRGKRRRVVIRERVYEVSERDIPALIEAELLDRAPPVTAEVVAGPKPPRKRRKSATQPVKTVEQVREVVQQIKARIEPDNAWLLQALETVAFRVLERLQDEEDSLMLLLAA